MNDWQGRLSLTSRWISRAPSRRPCKAQRGTIAQHAPALAICVYHRQQHLWELPLQIDALRRDYRLFLRR